MIQEKKNNNQLFHPVEPLDAHQMRSDPSLRIYLNRPHAVEISKAARGAHSQFTMQCNAIFSIQIPGSIQDPRFGSPNLASHVFVFVNCSEFWVQTCHLRRWMKRDGNLQCHLYFPASRINISIPSRSSRVPSCSLETHCKLPFPYPAPLDSLSACMQ